MLSKVKNIENREERERIAQHAERHTQSAKKSTLRVASSEQRTAQKIEQLITNNHQRK